MVWVVRVSKSRDGKEYYFNSDTGESTWTKPEDFASPPIKAKRKEGRPRQGAEGGEGGGGGGKRARAEVAEGAGGSAGGGDDDEEDTVNCFHLLVKWSGSRRPSSWREETITLSKEEAETRLAGFRTSLQATKAAGGAAAFKEVRTVCALSVHARSVLGGARVLWHSISCAYGSVRVVARLVVCPCNPPASPALRVPPYSPLGLP